mmetsp:Transcript_89867/g.178634  ORF Transcript_89867/g.178634 Transcript_89867/m.178634 type:complete len:127 (+) Transcript_89867:53-433(+)
MGVPSRRQSRLLLWSLSAALAVRLCSVKNAWLTTSSAFCSTKEVANIRTRTATDMGRARIWRCAGGEDGGKGKLGLQREDAPEGSNTDRFLSDPLVKGLLVFALGLGVFAVIGTITTGAPLVPGGP